MRVEQAGTWDRKKYKGSELSGKVVGVVGLGNIGRQVRDSALAACVCVCVCVCVYV